MTASEFAFLALGLVLGVASGAALSIVIRARPPAPREVRVTMATDAVPRRLPATLSEYAGSSAAVVASAARGGPADPNTLGAVDQIRTPVRSDPATREPVGITIRPEADALVEALDGATTIAVLDRALAAVGSANGSARAMVDAEPPNASRPIGSTDDQPMGTTGQQVGATGGGATGEGVPADGGPGGGAPTGPDPCADERRVADERCALADRLREAAQAAADRAREAQRAYDEHTGRSARASSVADPRAVRAAKEAAWTDFRRGNASAQSREAVEDAARDWLQEIDRINRTSQEAEQEALRERAAATALVTVIERVSLEADAARINSETAAEACIAARESLATCEEAHRERPDATPVEPSAEIVEDDGARLLLVGSPGFAPGGAHLDEDAPHRVFGDREPAILKLLRGDRETMSRTVTGLAGADPAEQRHWRLALSGLIDAIIARAIEASALEFPRDHAFWATFSQDQCRDIATALSSFGYRFDGLGGFVDGRVPSQRDLSLAVGYAGFDPMRLRGWPNEQELAELYRDVAVSAGEFLAAAAGGLTLGEMVGLLRDRAEGLTDLWNAWGRVRPLLLEP